MSESPAQADDSSLLENQVKELYRNSNLANLTVFAIATFLSLILLPVADPAVLTLWYLYIFAITIARAVATYQYKKTPSPDPRLWLNLHSGGLFLSGLGWGAVLLFVVPVEQRFHLVSAIFVIAGLATASAGSMASVKHGFAVFSIPALLPGALKLILINDNVTVLIGCGICAFLIFIAMVALRIHEVILYNLRKQFESAKFVHEVQEIHEALISRYDDLESQLKSSTQKVAELQAQLDAKSAENIAIANDAERKAKSDKFSYLLDKLHGGAWNYSLKTSEIRFSPQWLNMLGYKEDEVYGTMDFWKSLLHPEEQTEVVDKFHSHVNGKLSRYFSSHRLRARSGEWKWVFSRAQPVAWGTFGEVLDVVCVEIDIEDPETYLARKLTTVNFKASDWLYSESMFMERLQYALQTTGIEHIEHALCHISCYSTELPAETHLAPGNEMSKQLASILIRECRQEDPVLDLGNNSFAVLLENMAIDRALRKAASLQKTINAFQFEAGDQTYSVSTAIGITPVSDTRRTVTEIFEDAETACRIASSDTPDSLFVFQRDNAEFDAETLQKRILAKVRELLENKRLLLAASTLKAQTTPAARLSWLSASLPGPRNFTASIKELHEPGNTGLGSAFDLCVIRMFHDWALAQPAAAKDVENVYVYECREESLLDAEFIAEMKQHAVKLPRRHILCIGIPETVFTAHSDKIRAFINALKPAGLKFALTDFGAASFSFEYMKSLPVDYLELHDSLITSIDTDKTSLLTIRYLNEIGRVLNIKTVAACSGSEHHEAELAKAGIDYVRFIAPTSHSLTAPAKAPAVTRPVMIDEHGITH